MGTPRKRVGDCRRRMGTAQARERKRVRRAAQQEELGNAGGDVTKTSGRCDEEEEPLKAARVGGAGAGRGAAVERLGREVTSHGSRALSG